LPVANVSVENFSSSVTPHWAERETLPLKINRYVSKI
jgi:hypothetical protein